MTVIVAKPGELALKNRMERCNITLLDDSVTPNVPVDATELSLEVRDMGDTVVVSNSYLPAPTPPAVTRIIKTGTGQYYFPLGDTTIVGNTETTTVRELVNVWYAVGTAGTEPVNMIQKVRIISAQTISLAQDLQKFLDKTQKLVDTNYLDPCNLGYTEVDLIAYLEGGLSIINAYQPYPMWSGLDSFPLVHKQVLLRAALMEGLVAQTLFAVDSDLDNWNDNGQSLTIPHQPKLAAFLTTISQWLDARVAPMKMHYVSTGSVRTEIGPNFRLSVLINASPTSAVFRGVVFR